MDAGVDAGAESQFVSTGNLPSNELVQRLVAEAHERYRTNDDGSVSQVYPALERVPRSLFGVCVAEVTGNVCAAGETEVELTIMSVAKPFVYALVCRLLGREELRQRIGVNATGLPFNSLSAVEQSADGRTNPMVNPGAIAVTSLVPGADVEEKWRFIRDGLSRFAGRELALDDEVFRSASATNHRNQGLARLLQDYGRLYTDPLEAVDLYTRQSCLNVTARDLAFMGATLANGGVNPLTHERAVDPDSCHCTLAVMATAGLYETSGDWLYDIGLPGKSGIGGGIVTVAPGKGGLGTFAPLLDSAGNSVKGQLAAAFLSRRLGLDLFASKPDDDDDVGPGSLGSGRELDLGR
jgi:glutaminase